MFASAASARGAGGQGQGRRGSLGLGGRQEKRTLGAPGGADVRVHSAHAHVGAGAPGVEDSPQAEEVSALAVVVVGPALVLVRVLGAVVVRVRRRLSTRERVHWRQLDRRRAVRVPLRRVVCLRWCY